MKKNSTFTALLGVTQHDMATLLNVSRSQWPMYESGKKDLPLTGFGKINLIIILPDS